MSSVLIIGSEHLNRMKMITSILFLGLIVVNIIRLVTLIPDWSIEGSGFEIIMLYQFEGLTALSFIILLVCLVAYCLSMTSEVQKGVTRYLSVIVAIIWSALLIYMIAGIPTVESSFGQGWSKIFRWLWILMIIPMILTGILVLVHKHHFQRLGKNEISNPKESSPLIRESYD